MSNTRLWDKLGRTDPAHTKGFKRAGGFGGTAIKPIYTTQKMTETFGPAGKGWGMGEPTFQTVPGNDGQVAVFCTVSLWYREEGDSEGKVAVVYGVGGDMVVVKQSNGMRTDDEAFKKAFTDAIGNAMKHIGMSADVHMGLFDDSKYVQEMRDEAKSASKAPEKPAGGNKTQDRMVGHVSAVSAAIDLDKLKKAWEAIDADQTLSQDDYDQLKVAVNQRKAQLTKPEVPANFDNLEK